MAALANAGLTLDEQARLIAGFTPLEQTADTAAVTSSSQWNNGDRFSNHWNKEETYEHGLVNLFSPSNHQLLNDFFARNLGRSRDATKNLLYFFGGPDVLFPNLLFPNLEKVVLVGLENPGVLLDPAQLKAQGTLGQKMAEISRAYVSVMRMSYYITNEMSSQLQGFGTTTMIAVGLVANNFTIQAVDRIALDESGVPAPHPAGNGVRIRYTKPNGVKGEVYYFQQNLSDGKIDAAPGFIRFIKSIHFDTAYFKAASYVPSWSDSRTVDNLVLSSVDHVVQNDDGLPIQAFKTEAAKWDLKIFGIYTRPDRQFGASAQMDLNQMYGAKICLSGDERDISLWQKLWNAGCSGRTDSFGFASLAWEGTLPFHYGYSGMSGPGTYAGNPLPAGIAIDWNEMMKWSNLLVADKFK